LPWGDKWTGKEANFCGKECRFGKRDDHDDGSPAVAPIGHFSSTSPYGLIDTAGNLWEWAADCFASGAHWAVPPGSQDPVYAPEAGCRRFLRGGGYSSYAGFLEKRNAEGLPDVDVPSRGARCVFDFGIEHKPFSGHR
jgi:formylglycine-generating enzyme required for sulfatase activity